MVIRIIHVAYGRSQGSYEASMQLAGLGLGRGGLLRNGLEIYVTSPDAGEISALSKPTSLAITMPTLIVSYLLLACLIGRRRNRSPRGL